MHQPKLLVLDEPTASLDPDVAHRVRSGLERICAEDGTALLVTSHNMQEVERLCARVVFVAGGRVVADGTPEAVAAAVRPRRPRRRVPAPRRIRRGADHRRQDGAVMRAQRVWAVARRQGYVLKRAPQRWFDVIVWPVVDAILFGAIGVYFGRQHGTAAASVAFLLAGIILFHVVFQAEISLATGFLEETWSRNLLNLMVTPLTELEYGAGVVLFGLARLAIGVTVVSVVAFALFAFNITTLGLALDPAGRHPAGGRLVGRRCSSSASSCGSGRAPRSSPGGSSRSCCRCRGSSTR